MREWQGESPGGGIGARARCRDPRSCKEVLICFHVTLASEDIAPVRSHQIVGEVSVEVDKLPHFASIVGDLNVCQRDIDRNNASSNGLLPPRERLYTVDVIGSIPVGPTLRMCCSVGHS
jgi:hypothetical protein